MGKKDDDKDLRKEVEMTEHHATTDEVARQYETDLANGLTDAEVKKVQGWPYKGTLKGHLRQQTREDRFSILSSSFVQNLVNY